MIKAFGGILGMGFGMVGATVWAGVPISPMIEQSAVQSDQTHASDLTSTPQSTLYLQSYEELANHPLVLEHLLDTAVRQEHMALVEQLLPIYTQVGQDKILLQYANALFARHKGDVKQAIHLLKALKTAHPTHKPMAFELAKTYVLDKRHVSAKAVFDEVKSDPNLPEAIGQQIEEYNHYQKQQLFKTTANLHYLDEDNVNQAPTQSTYGNWQLPKPESAHGIGYQVGVGGQKMVADQWSLGYRLATTGKYYWDNKAYNDQTTQAGLEIAYQSAYYDVGISPVIANRRFANQSYSKTAAVQLKHTSRAYHSPLQVMHNFGLSYVKHEQRKHLDGMDVAFSGVWLTNNPYGLYMGYHLNVDNAKDDSDTNTQVGVSVGVSRAFGPIVTQAALGFYHRLYEGKDLFQIQRQDKVYTADASLYNKEWHYKGVTPKLVMSYQKTDSNHFMYKNDNKAVYLSLQKLY